ncbi:hypothetical protein [Azospirillum himalayense]|uniref:Uncharacterized protein n=1 Tax=Azospirillum himalayense TaxID=654847 RepID=A0ABW0G7Y9_9PROT
MSKAVKEAPQLKVIARYAGHYGEKHIREGQTFELAAPGDFAPSWMKPEGEGLGVPAEKTNTET